MLVNDFEFLVASRSHDGSIFAAIIDPPESFDHTHAEQFINEKMQEVLLRGDHQDGIVFAYQISLVIREDVHEREDHWVIVKTHVDRHLYIFRRTQETTLPLLLSLQLLLLRRPPSLPHLDL